VSAPDEGTEAARILSWAYLLVLAFLTGVGRAFYASQEMQPSAQYEVVTRWALLTFAWYWIVCQLRARQGSLPLDAGLFVYILGPFAAPALLWRLERWRSVLKTAIVVAIFAAGHLLSVVVRHVIVALR
jgi:hypothetical protein